LETTDEAETFTGTVSVPEDAVLGATRLRVRLMYTGDVLPCGTTDYGDVEDYTVIVEQGSSVADRLAGDWSIFPNPSNGDITIRGMQITGNAQVEVRDMTGRIVYSTSRAFNAGELATFQLAGKLAAGTYSFV
ncbi:MAG TPA: GEVED domain-containing protein, partial [Flavobacteriales bacterium]|nr:GEVED domain-containing protein [Flavobacteriales bacterium]